MPRPRSHDMKNVVILHCSMLVWAGIRVGFENWNPSGHNFLNVKYSLKNRDNLRIMV